MAPLRTSVACRLFDGFSFTGRALPLSCVLLATCAAHVAANSLPDSEGLACDHRFSEDEQFQQLFLLQKSYSEEPRAKKPDQAFIPEGRCGSPTSLEFLHIPKTAGTAIEDAGSPVGMHWGRFGTYDGCYTLGYTMVGEVRRCSPWHMPPRFVDRPNMYSKASEVFCVTRHPYDRAISEYKYAVEASASVRRMLGYDRFFRELATIDECTADGLNTFLKVALREYQKGNYFLLDGHLIPQAQYVYDADGHKWCQTVLEMHKFPNNFNQLMSSHNLSIKINNAAGADNAGACQGLDFSHLTGEVKALLKEVYAEDFELLGYRVCEGLCREIKTPWASHCDCGPLPPVVSEASYFAKQYIGSKSEEAAHTS